MASLQGSGKTKPGLFRGILRWVLALLILWFIGNRLIRDWPSVKDAFETMSWGWIGLSLIPGFFYLLPRISSWRSILRNLGVRTRFWQAAKVWVNGEIVRYIPGNVWSVLGRLAQAGSIGTTRTVVFSSMVLEALLLVAACTALSAVLLTGFQAWQFPGRTILLLVIACATLLITHRRVAQWLVNAVFRVLKRKDQAPVVSHIASAFGWMLLSWVSFGLFQLLVTKSLGVPLTFGEGITLIGVFLFSWLLGYLSFVTPSGLGVREAMTVVLLQPYMSTGQAILVAVVSRAFMILVEVVGLGIVNVLALRTKQLEPPAEHDLR